MKHVIFIARESWWGFHDKEEEVPSPYMNGAKFCKKSYEIIFKY